MPRGLIIPLCALLTGLLGTPPAAAAPQSASDSAKIQQLIDRLSDADARVRRQTVDSLAEIGPAARPQLIRAARSLDPEVRARAAEALRKLPWDSPDDPPAVRTLLRRYGQVNDDGRDEIIQRIERIDKGDRTLLRLLRVEPSDSVRWTIVVVLASDSAHDAEQLERIRQAAWLEQSDDPPALLLLGQAWLDRDKMRALTYLRRAIDANEARTTDDPGLLPFAYETLTDAAMANGEFDQAASLLRRRLPENDRRSWWRRRQGAMLMPDDLDDPAARADLSVLPRLMALHELFGPLKGYEFDVRTWGRDHPAPVSLARRIVILLGRLGAPPPIVCPTIDLSGEDHFAAAVFLLRNHLPVAAGLEADAALSAARKRRPDVLEAGVAFLRAELAIQRQDDTAAADLLERAMRLRADSHLRTIGQDDDIWAQIHWFRAKAALAKGDLKTVNARVHDLQQLDLGNTDLAINIINWLKDNGHAPAGKAIFDKLYEQARTRLVSPDAELTAGLQNDLAWLCARSGERLEEALKLAKSAVDSSPHNPAFLDTLAEAQFRTGQTQAAIKSESRALELSPDNEFMKQQLQRFRSATTRP